MKGRTPRASGEGDVLTAGRFPEVSRVVFHPAAGAVDPVARAAGREARFREAEAGKGEES